MVAEPIPTPDQPDQPAEPIDLAALWEDTKAGLAEAFAVIEWGEDEIEQAQRRHPDHADLLYHAFKLIAPSSGMPLTEFVVRGHARELLERVAAGEDTRPATAAEVCVICSEMSLRAPLTTAAAGLYLRMWAAAFPDNPAPGADAAEHYEGLRSVEIDDLERLTRRRATVRDRRLPKDLTCDGRHHGEAVACRYAKPDQPVPPTTTVKRLPVRALPAPPPATEDDDQASLVGEENP